jgi:hypothetical protein
MRMIMRVNQWIAMYVCGEGRMERGWGRYLYFEGEHERGIICASRRFGEVVHDDGMSRGEVDLGVGALGGRAHGVDKCGDVLEPSPVAGVEGHVVEGKEKLGWDDGGEKAAGEFAGGDVGATGWVTPGGG